MFLSNGSLVTKTPFSISPGYSTSWFPSMPAMSSGWPSAYSGIYKAQLWVYVLVNKLAAAEARLPLPVYTRKADDSRERNSDHPMAKLLRQPNPGLAGFTLMEWTSATEDIYGRAFWYKQRKGGIVVALYPLHPSSMSRTDGLWTFDNGSKVIADIPDSDLVHFSRYEGLSPLEPLRSTLENEWHARSATSSFWQRGARPAMALKHPENLSEAAQGRLRAQMDSLHAGSGNTGSTMILEEGMTPQTMTLTAEEAQYIETRKLNREEVCAAYDVPPPVVHILDRATFSNITEQMRSMYRDTMAPRLKRREATIEQDLRLAEWPDDNIYAEFLMDEVLRGDFEARQDALAKASHMTIAEKRRIENLPFIKGTDRIFLNTATLPLDAIDAAAAADVAAAQVPKPAPEVPPAAVAAPPLRSVAGRLSWQKTLDEVDPLLLVKGLSDGEALRVFAAVAEERKAGGTVAGLRRRLVAAKGFDLTPDQEKVSSVLKAFFRKQSLSDEDLTAEIHAVSLEVSAGIGLATAKQLGFDGQYDVDRTSAFLLAVAERLAVNVNTTTKDQLEAADDKAAVWQQAEDSRAPGVAVITTTIISGFAATEAARQLAQSEGVTPTKTWRAGSNPRSTHAALDGETVGIDETFSNGMDWPGSGGDVEEVAGCNCTVDIQTGD